MYQTATTTTKTNKLEQNGSAFLRSSISNCEVAAATILDAIIFIQLKLTSSGKWDREVLYKSSSSENAAIQSFCFDAATYFLFLVCRIDNVTNMTGNFPYII